MHLEALTVSQIQTEKPELVSFEVMDVPVQASTYRCGLLAVECTCLRNVTSGVPVPPTQDEKYVWQCFEEREDGN